MSSAVSMEMAKPMLDGLCGRRAGRDGRVDADDLAGGVHERAAGVARADRGVGLDQVVERAVARCRSSGRAAETMPCGDGHAAFESQGVADGDDRGRRPSAARRSARSAATSPWCPRPAGRRCRRLASAGDHRRGPRHGRRCRGRLRSWSHPSTTWALVRMRPSSSMTMPVPAPSTSPEDAPPCTSVVVRIDTTDGSTASTRAPMSSAVSRVSATLRPAR